MLSNLSDDFKLSLQNVYVSVSVCVFVFVVGCGDQ